MITPAILQDDDRKAAEAKKANEEQRVREYEEWLRKKLREDLIRVETLAAGKMDDLIRKLNRKGIKRVRCEQFKSYDRFELGFAPDPDYEPTQKLVAALREAGFTAVALTDWVQNTECETWGDGEYRFVDAPGTHPIHELIVSSETEFPVGAKVLTVEPAKQANDWSGCARQVRRWGIRGVVQSRHDAHGLSYRVSHGDGTEAWYEPHELLRV